MEPSPLVSEVHGKEKRWNAEFAALRELCLATSLHEDLKWGQACYDLDGRSVVLIHGFDEIRKRKTAVKASLADAIAVQKSGAEVAMKTAAEFDLPEEFAERLDHDAGLAEAFHALTPGRRKAYLLHFAGAKQKATREARVAKHVPRILEGFGLDD